MNLGDDFFKEAYEKISSTINEIGEQNANELKDYYSKHIDEYGGVSEFLSFALNTQERECDLITFGECVKWIKDYLNPEIHSGAVIFRKENGKYSSSDGYNYILI